MRMLSGLISLYAAQQRNIMARRRLLPMDKPKFMNCLNRQNALGHVEPGNILAEGIVLDEHGHQVTARQELHDQIEIRRVLEGVEQLDDPRRIGLGQNVTFSAHMSELKHKYIRTTVR